MIITNEDRATRAEAALEYYSKYAGDLMDEDSVTGLLVDLMHYGRLRLKEKRTEAWMSDHLRTAVMNFEAEVADEAQPNS